MINVNTIDLSIIIPCYNEENNIPYILREFNNILKTYADMNIELILVDNGSIDNTGKVIDEEIPKNAYTFVRKVYVKVNKGYGFGILSGLKVARGHLLAFTHGDLQTDPADVFRAYELYLAKSRIEKKVFIKGRRCNRRLNERLFSLGMQGLTSTILGMYLSEINAQPKLFPRKITDLMTEPPLDFSLDLYVVSLAKKAGFKIYEIPVYLKKRQFGQAKGGSGSRFRTKWKIIKSTFRYLFVLKKILRTKFSSSSAP